MKFRFCGGLDCPDWILGEVSTLSKLSSVRMKLLCRQVIRQLTGQGVNYEKINTLTTSKRISWNSGDVKALIAALHFIITKYEVELDILPQELQQLGLPQDICKAVCREYSNAQTFWRLKHSYAQAIRSYLVSQTLHFPRLTKTEWRADYILSSNDAKIVGAPSIRMQLGFSKPVATGATSVGFEMPATKFLVLFNELKTARALMEQC